MRGNNIQEMWKPIKNYEGLYEISNFGNVKSLERICKTEKGTRIVPEKMLSASKDSSGYLYVPLSVNGTHKNYFVHRLVLEAFESNTERKKQVNHKNGNKLNNCLDNLEWCTAKENINHKYKVLNYKAHNRKKVICLETNEIFESLAEAEKSKKLTGISKCLKGKRETFAGYHWEYLKKESDEEI